MKRPRDNSRLEQLERFKRLEPVERISYNNTGSALIITLLLIAILTGLVVDFVYEVYIDSSTLSNWANAQRASLIAKSGQTVGVEFIKEIRKETFTDKREMLLPVDWDFGPNVALVIKLEDENSRFNINSLVDDRGVANDNIIESLKNMLEYLNINPNLALSIADWIDTDGEPKRYRSEDHAKNDLLWSVDELKLIEGVTKDIFDKISPYMTVHKEADVFFPVININTAQLPVLMAIDQNMTESIAKNIIEHRESYPFEVPANVRSVSGMEQMDLSRITFKASNIKVISIATVNEITRITESVIDSSDKVIFWREG